MEISIETQPSSAVYFELTSNWFLVLEIEMEIQLLILNEFRFNILGSCRQLQVAVEGM